ncbi:aminotransferase class I/II-fold pyridoxal phosphate-dependent enzyme (plasmid) [Agrobacterium sp. MA01]|uniref:aminotransferase class I/II-fold pyridoxal phosphate-dependent enzyme n=1 Tax=Agrobacterium sp. MA01 TaxID=2664893 RepID=UPI00129A2096|nr:aminotransferase class I/II-fold pyridoxal phosphate-dependent enzyme [Agrobacterium sp. MA01]QGG93287.1 aminotransferase class I/II-fold pyridoxal phosphate-dependent enzyme [Agrobacterium sp. MA01]
MRASAKSPCVISSRKGGRATINGTEMIVLGSNDYLGLSTDPRVLSSVIEALQQFGSGACIYPTFVSTTLHEELCEELAAYLGTEAVILYSSGGAANSGVLTTLVGEGDTIFSDRLNHASIIDACRLSRATVVTYPNRDVDGLKQALNAASPQGKRLVVTDGIFSMEGGAAPLLEIYALAQEYDALLMVDEAHATGVVGPNGTGTAPLCGLPNNSPGLVLTGSLSKALGGASGGFVAGAAEEVAKLRAASRGWIFTMGLTTANVATALAATKICRSDPVLNYCLWANVSRLRRILETRGLSYYRSDNPITSLKIGNEDEAVSLSRSLANERIYAPAVIYPVVARSEARLRLQVSAAHTFEDIDEAGRTIATMIPQSP